MSIGSNIKKIREEKNITQNDLAKKMGISRSYLGDLENDRRSPSAKTLESLAQKLDISMPYLLEGDKNMSDFEKAVSVYCNSLNDVDNVLEQIQHCKQMIEMNKTNLQSVKLQKKELIKEGERLQEEINQETNTKERIALLEKQVEIHKQLEEYDRRVHQSQVMIDHVITQLIIFTKGKDNISKILEEQKLMIEKQLEISYVNALDKINK